MHDNEKKEMFSKAKETINNTLELIDNLYQRNIELSIVAKTIATMHLQNTITMFGQRTEKEQEKIVDDFIETILKVVRDDEKPN